jgi:molybdate transport system substrate-binding protein
VRRLAIGHPESVPAGVYARQWLERLRLWSAVQPKTVPLATVRAALAAVREGRADAGIVYATDAQTTPEVKIAYRVPVEEVSPIIYPAALVRGGAEAEAGRFIAYLRGPEASAVFERAGFGVLGSR